MKSILHRLAKFAFLIALGLGLAGHLHAQAQNLDKTGRALQGYDPVAFFTQGKPVKGNPNISSKINGATYHFASTDANWPTVSKKKPSTSLFGG
jgi:hypothetical protein